MTKRIDLTGRKFGHLIVLEMIYDYNNGNNKRKRTYCKCKCDCGKECIIEKEHLQRRKNISCGCMSNYYRKINNRTNEIGKKYGSLTIIDIDYSVKPSIAICKCDCGNIKRIIKSDVISGHTISCGCLHKKMASICNTKDYTDYISESGVKIKNRAYKEKVWYWNCECPICGNDFVALPAKIISNHTTSCGCKLESSGERIIENYLIKNHINYEKQKRFPECKYKYTLPFDFAIYNKSNELIYLIEYDGQQHFKPVPFWGGEKGFKEIQLRDSIKNNYCKKNNIPLLRIDYIKTINEIKNILQTLFIRNDCNTLYGDI